MANSYTLSTPRTGLTQLTFPNGYVLSIGYGTGHYASWVIGERFGPEGSHHFPTSFELAVMDKNGGFIPIGNHDDVAGWQPWEVIEALITKLESGDLNLMEAIK